MKLKHLLKFLPGIALILPISVFAQQDGVIHHDASVIKSPVIQTIYDDGRIAGSINHQTEYISKVLNPPGCDTLFGDTMPTNGFNGIMFNVQCTGAMTTVEFINAYLNGPGSGYIRLYARFGTWVGHETDLAGWSLVDSVLMNVPTSGLYRIPIYIGQTLHVNEKAGYYLTFTPGSSAGVDYGNGVGLIQDTLYSSDANLKLFEGVGHGNLFDACCQPRVFAGTIEHCPTAVNDCQNFTTTYVGGNGYDGNMFNIVTNHDIIIKGFSGHVVDSGYHKLYYRYGSYAGHQDSASQWTFVDSNYVVSAGVGVPTQTFSNLNILLNAGESMALYLTSTGGTNGGVNYTNGTAEGNLFAYDGVVKFYEGLGMIYPFSGNISPRIWNGTIDYCIVPGFIGIEENPDPGKQPIIYPVPTTGELFMDFKGVEGDRKIVITDMTGRVCKELNNQQSNLIHLNIHEFSNGIYIYSVFNKGSKEGSGKFIKQ